MFPIFLGTYDFSYKKPCRSTSRAIRFHRGFVGVGELHPCGSNRRELTFADARCGSLCVLWVLEAAILGVHQGDGLEEKKESLLKKYEMSNLKNGSLSCQNFNLERS